MAEHSPFDTVFGWLRGLIRWRWFGVANSVVVLGLLVYMLSHRLEGIDWKNFLFNTRPGWIVCAVSSAIAAVLTTSLRTRDILQREAGRPIGLPSIFRLQFIALFMAFAMPISVAVDVVRIGMYRLRYGLPLSVCTRAVIFDRALGAIGIIFVGIITFALQPLLYNAPYYLVSFQAVMLAATVVFIGVLVVLSRRETELRWPPLQLVVRWMSKLGSHISGADFLLRQSVYAILYVASAGLVLMFLSGALNFQIPPLLIIAFTPVILFVSNLPFLYAGWGGRELIIVVTLSGVGGARADEALMLSIAYGLAMLVAALPGAVFWIARPTFRKQLADGAEPLTTRANRA
jgi:uncharacterized membrane protein YbhN (UPF0104 family)